MFKFLRKYNKWILAVGGTLLMIVFLIPQAIEQLSQAAAVSGATQATIGPGGSEEVPATTLRQVQTDLQNMDRLNIRVGRLGRIENPWHWYLLVREAQDAGLIGGSMSGQISAEQAQLIRDQTGLGVDTVDRLYGKVAGVQRLINLFQTAGQLSDRRLRHAADRLFYTAEIQTVVLEADAEGDYQPSEAEIREQMEAYAEFDADDPESVYGYKLPNRVKLEWLTVPVASIEAMLETSDMLSGKALRKHWLQNKNNPDLPPVPDVAPTVVPDAVRADLLSSLTEQKREEIARLATNQLRARAHGLPRKDGYLVPSDDWETTRLSFQELADMIADRFGVARPIYRSSGTWLDSDDLNALEGIGSGTTASYPPGLKSLDDLVTLFKEFEGSTTVLLQSGVAGPPLQDEDGSLYFFRVIDTDAARAPASVDEVRDRVVEDLRRQKNYETLKASLAAMEKEAESAGMVALALANDTIVQPSQTVSLYDQGQLQIQTLIGQPLTPVATSLPVIGTHNETVKAMIDYVRTLRADLDDEALSEEQRVFGVPVDDRLAVIVARLGNRAPFLESTYAQRVDSNELHTIVLNEELDDGQAVLDSFTYEALAARHNFTVLDATPDDPTTQPTEVTVQAEGE